MSYFPPQNLGEVKKGVGDVRGARVLVTLSPQIQFDRSASGREPRGGGLTSSPEGGHYYDRFLRMLGDRLAARGAKPATELRDLNDLAAPKLADLIARDRPDYVLRLSQERMGLINREPASIVWLVQLARVSPGKLDVVFEEHHSVAGVYCLATKVREFAEPTAMECLGKQADHIVARLDANGFFTGAAAPAVPRGGAAALWSEPPPPRKQGQGTSTLCMSQAPGVTCK